MKTRKIESSQVNDSFLANVGLGAPTTRPVTTRTGTRRTYTGSRRHLAQPQILEGTVQLHPNGFGFVTHVTASGATESYFVRPALTQGLLSNDTVRFVPAKQSPVDISRDSRSVHQVVAYERRPTVLLCEVGENGVLTPDEPCSVPVLAKNVGDLNAQRGDVLVVMVAAAAGEPSLAAIQGTAVRNLGQRSRSDFTLDYAQAKFGFDSEMPDDVLADDPAALTLVERLAMMAELRVTGTSETPFVTIDGESTLDFDDAVHVQQLADGWLVQVAISDVAMFVTPGSALDKWASSRSTSVYLPGRKVPMLPEILSQGACSLQQGVPRYAVVQTLRLDEAGEVRDVEFKRELIRVAGQLSYQQVADFMDSGTPISHGIGGVALVDDLAVGENVSALTALYPVLAARRLAKGLMDFEEPDPMPEQVDGKWRLRWAPRTLAHKLVEELMLMANQAAAAHLVKRYGAGLFRHQPAPDAAAWAELRSWAKGKGLELPESPAIQAMTALAINQKSADEQAAAVMKLRSAMRPAKYVAMQADLPGGHFSLAFDWYTHFTSPIRRYPDLLVHRLLTAPADFHLTEAAFDELVQKVNQCSERAHAAKMAERFVLDRLKMSTLLDAMAGKEAEPLHGRVIRQNQRGVKVLLSGWQTVGWLGAGCLLSSGYAWGGDAWVAPTAAGGKTLEEGSSIFVSGPHLSHDRPAYPELHVRMQE